MKRGLSVIVLAGAVTACNPSGCDGPQPRPTPAPTASATATADSGDSKTGSHASGARSVSEETDDFLFEYAYPAEAGRQEGLAAVLDRRLDRARADLAAEAAQAREQAREQGFPYNKHSYTAEWKLVAELPQWTSLSGDIATFTGGAHGNYTRQSLVWDKQHLRAMNGIQLFASPQALEAAWGTRFCDALRRQRAARLKEATGADADTEFVNGQCAKIDDLEILVGSSNRRTFNRLTVYAGPYVAGSYAEGAYEVDLNVDQAILDAVRPEYRAAFSARN